MSDKLIPIIERLFKIDHHEITPIVEFKNGEYSILIKEEFVVVYEPNTFSPVFKFFRDDKIVLTINESTVDLGFYDILDSFLPDIKIKIYWKKKGIDEYKYIMRDYEVIPVATISGATFVNV